MNFYQQMLTSIKANHRNATQRCGFSLIELIFVMAILLVVATLSIPTIQRSFSRQAISKGAGLLRASMGQARIKAIKTGEIHALYYMPGKSWHGVAPFANAQEQMSVARRRAQEAEQRPTTDFDDDLLPRGVIFAEGDALLDARAAQAVQDENQSTQSDVLMVLFYPDGTSQDAQILLENEFGALVQVTVRGLTGSASTVRLKQR